MNNIIEEIQKNNNIVLFVHINPDGDAIGSSLGLYNALIKIGKKVDVIINNPPEKFSFLKGFDQIKDDIKKDYDLAIVLDTSSYSRIGDFNNAIIRARKIIVIDHHKNNELYGDINFISLLPACAQIVYNLIKEMNISLDYNISESLATGILTDTSSLSNDNVESSTFSAMAELSKFTNIPKIHKKVFASITYSQFELRKIVYNNLEFYKDGKIVFSFITEEMLNKLSVKKEDADLLSSTGKEIENVEVTIFTRIFSDSIRISLRSNNVDISEVASHFGGGGHPLASGIITEKKIEEIKDKLIEEVSDKIDEWYFNSK